MLIFHPYVFIKVFKYFAYFLIGLVGFLLLSFETALHILNIGILADMICKYFLSVYNLSLHSLNSVF